MSVPQFRVRSIVLPGMLIAMTWLIVGMVAMRYVLSLAPVRYHSVNPEARLAAWMAALFAGGAAAVVVLVAYLLITRKRNR